MVTTKLIGCEEVVRRKACTNEVSARIRKTPIEISMAMSAMSAMRCVQVILTSW